ncbi:uncharacterized protein [Labrus bergylta]|uniref:uncharacterized protein isoform X1 n=1 Tax=Labrus bergylta TaxID=56723 RepID=UPI003313E767
MKVRHTLIFFVFISTTLENGDACLTERDILNHTATEGGNFKIKCYFDNPDERKIFCRDDCREEDILVETSGVRAQRGRYSIGYNEEHVGMSIMPLYVSIKHLTKADSGRYSCVFGNLQSPSDTQVMELRVEGAPTTSEPSQTIQPLSTSAPPASTPTTTLEKLATPAAARGLPQETNPGVQLNVQLVLILMIIVLSAAVLIVCRRTRKPQESHVGLEDVNIISADGLHEEAREKILEM